MRGDAIAIGFNPAYKFANFHRTQPKPNNIISALL